MDIHATGLPSHPDHERAARQYRGFGGMLSFALDGTVAQADAALSRLQLFAVAPSLGGVESLVTRPALTSHAGIPPAERQAMGISDTLIRLSTGLEATEDLLADLEQALASL